MLISWAINRRILQWWFPQCLEVLAFSILGEKQEAAAAVEGSNPVAWEKLNSSSSGSSLSSESSDSKVPHSLSCFKFRTDGPTRFARDWVPRLLAYQAAGRGNSLTSSPISLSSTRERRSISSLEVLSPE